MLTNEVLLEVRHIYQPVWYQSSLAWQGCQGLSTAKWEKQQPHKYNQAGLLMSFSSQSGCSDAETV